MRTRSSSTKTIRNGSVELAINQEKDCYRVTWYEAGERKRVRKATASAAESFAKKKAASLAEGAPHRSPEAPEALRYYRELEARMNGTPLHIAVDFWLNHHAKQKMLPAKMEDLFPLFLTQLEEDKLSTSYRNAIGKYIRPFVTDHPGLIHQITSEEIDRWARHRTESLHSRRHFLNYLKTFFNWARDMKKALPRGETEADLVPVPDPKAAPIEVYTPAEMRRLLQFAANDGEIALLVLGGFVGLRNSEITGEETDHPPLQIEDILFEEDAVRVIQKVQKQSVIRYAPLLPNAKSWLLPLKDQTGPVVDFNRAHLVLTAIAERANVAARQGDITLRTKRNGLRRSHITYRATITRDVPRVADECNTSPEKIRKNYRRPGLEKVAHEYYAIARLTALARPAGKTGRPHDTAGAIVSIPSAGS